jgi:hypothetical protein
MNFNAKRAELVLLMHKFVPRSRVEIFCIKHTGSTPLDPTNVLGHLGPFCYYTNFHAKWVELVQLMHNFLQ